MEEQIPQITPVEPNQTPKKFNWLTIVGLFLILAVALAGALFLKQKVSPKPDNQNSSNQPATTGSEPLVSGLVDWHYPVSSYLAIVKSGVQDQSGLTFYDVGTFKTGIYQGQDLYVALISCGGPCGNTLLRIVSDIKSSGNHMAVLKNYSDSLDNVNVDLVDMSKLTVDSTTKIPDLEAPKDISGPKPNQSLTQALSGAFQSSYNIFNVTNLKPVYVDSKVGQVYTTPDDSKSVDSFYGSYGFYVKAPDWNVIVYKSIPSFVGPDNIPQVNWTGNGQNKDEFNYVHIGGCGSTDYAAAVDLGTIATSDLKATGKTSGGDVVYEFKDANTQMLKDMYDQEYNPYNSSYQTDASLKIPYEQFVASHPMFFWTDPFGRLIQFKNKKFIVSAAECGKPVIYLYPTKTENVNVKLNPTGGFSYTEPDYANGWNVVANPNGQLINSDGKTYPYLFWEGRSNNIYQIPDKGFVIAKENVHEFLDSKLALLGLNKKESADFEAYWEPYMQSASYYFVTFMGNTVMDRIAPLQVTPKPDTVIRILMDFKPLDKFISVQGYDIKTPERSGFTVVEWGGVKH